MTTTPAEKATAVLKPNQLDYLESELRKIKTPEEAAMRFYLFEYAANAITQLRALLSRLQGGTGE